MMRSQQKKKFIQNWLIDLASASGIKPKVNYDLMGREVEGRANLGYTPTMI